MHKLKKILKNISTHPSSAYKVISVVIFVFGIILVSLYINKNHNKTEESTEVSIDKNSDLQHNSENDSDNFQINIEKIKIEAPVILGVDPSNEKKYNQALKDGVVHMVGTALPGNNKGNIFIYGHSSAKEKSKYSEIFLKLDELKFNDKIEIVYNKKNMSTLFAIKKLLKKTIFLCLNKPKMNNSHL